MQNEISTEVFAAAGQAYPANYHFLKAKLLLRNKKAYHASYNKYQRSYEMKVGAKSVLMSLWLANDQSTSDIIGDFYRNLADKQGKGEAPRNAKLKYLSTADNLSAHPFYWSHLILSGDGAPLSSLGFPTLWLLIGFGLLVVAFLAFRKNQKSVN